MACCILLAAVFGGAFGLKSLLLFTPGHKGSAQDWRLMEQKENHE